MSLKTDDVLAIAQLARLHIGADEIERYADDLSSILDLVEQMNRVDSSGVEPLANPLDATQRLRDDEVTEVDQRDMGHRSDEEEGQAAAEGAGP